MFRLQALGRHCETCARVLLQAANAAFFGEPERATVGDDGDDGDSGGAGGAGGGGGDNDDVAAAIAAVRATGQDGSDRASRVSLAGPDDDAMPWVLFSFA